MGQKIKQLRVVLDTNILISTLLLSASNWKWLRNAWIWEEIRPVMCKSTTIELFRVLAYPKFRLEVFEQEALIADILPYAEACADPKHDASLPKCRDPNDQLFIDLAWAQKADFLVRGDCDILEYPPQNGLHVIKPHDFRELLVNEP